VSVALKPAGIRAGEEVWGARLTCEIAGGVPPPASEVSPRDTQPTRRRERGATLATVAAGFLVDEHRFMVQWAGMSTIAPPRRRKSTFAVRTHGGRSGQVLSHYRSDLVERIRASGHVLSAGDLSVKLAKQFGFCYGVERPLTWPTPRKSSRQPFISGKSSTTGSE